MANTMNEHLVAELLKAANEQFDGHLTIMKFTTNWRVGFGTPYNRDDIDAMAVGKTFDEAVQRALERALSERTQMGAIR